MSVGEYSNSYQITNVVSESTLLVANLHSPFVPQTYTTETKSPVKCREMQPFFESVNDVI